MNANKKFEEGGVIGFYDNSSLDVAKLIYYGLYALQHRGQTGCGIVLNDRYHLSEIKGKGLVSQVISPHIGELRGNMGAAHVRYGTATDGIESVLPLNSVYIKGTLTISLAGAILNSERIKRQLEDEGGIFQVGSDAEILAHLIARERVKTPSVEQAVLAVAKKIDGAFAAIILSPKKLIALRDKSGLRPLCMGKINNSLCFASESVAFDAMGADFVRDVNAGELIAVSSEGISSYSTIEGDICPNAHTCSYEYMYFARPDSIIDGVSVYEVRLNAGKELFKSHPVDADVVIGVPSAGLHYALGYSIEGKIPFGDGLIRNYYVGRTDRTGISRENLLNAKLNVLRSAIEGKRVALIDDSLIKGSTAQRLISRLKESGAKEVHLRLGTPRFLSPCPHSPSLNTVLKDMTDEQIRISIGADSIGFLPCTSLNKTGIKPLFCKDCYRS